MTSPEGEPGYCTACRGYHLLAPVPEWGGSARTRRRHPVQPDDQPWCGAELLPHATGPDGTPAPILCTLPVHSRYFMHRNDERKTSWRWQDADGNWILGPATEYPA